MTAIYFHSLSGEARLRGSERAYMGMLCNDLFLATIRFPSAGDQRESVWIVDLIPKNSYVHSDIERTWEVNKYAAHQNTERLSHSLKLWLRSIGEDAFFHLGDEKIRVSSTMFNTALVVGSDPVKLAARLHGQCEVHCYVRGPNRAWLADIIKQGRESKIFRSDQGWEEVIVLLQSNQEEDVVCSYSVGESFPNRHLASQATDLTQIPEYKADFDGDWWYDVPPERRWQLAFKSLPSSAELRPDNWNKFHFRHGINTFQLEEMVCKLRREKQANMR